MDGKWTGKGAREEGREGGKEGLKQKDVGEKINKRNIKTKRVAGSQTERERVRKKEEREREKQPFSLPFSLHKLASPSIMVTACEEDVRLRAVCVCMC